MVVAFVWASEREELSDELVRVRHALVALPFSQNLGPSCRDARYLQRPLKKKWQP